MNELVKVDMSQFGLDETKAAEVKKDFDAVLKIAVELEDQFNEVVAMPITKETCAVAKTVRLKYVKVRTAIAAVHKDRKAFYLSGGRAIDGLKNAYTHAVEGNEAKLEAIEKHFENLERERIAKLQEERAEVLAAFSPDYIPSDLGTMGDAVWQNYILGAQMAHKAKIDAEAKAEADRIAREKAEAEERERMRLENERLKAEAVERERLSRIEIEKRAKEEAERLAKERAEREAREKDERERIAAEKKKQAEHEAALKAEREAREKLEQEAAQKSAKEAAERAEADRLARDKAHRAKIHGEAVSGLLTVGLTEDQAKDVVRAIVSGKIANVSIKY